MNARQKHTIVLANVFLLTNRDLISLVIKHSLQHSAWIYVLLVSQSHRSEENLELLDELHARINQLFLQVAMILVVLGDSSASLSRRLSILRILCLLMDFEHFNLEVEDLADEVRQRIVHLQERIEVARVPNVTQTRGLIILADSLVHARNRLIIQIVRALLFHACSDGLLQLGVLQLA